MTVGALSLRCRVLTNPPAAADTTRAAAGVIRVLIWDSVSSKASVPCNGHQAVIYINQTLWGLIFLFPLIAPNRDSTVRSARFSSAQHHKVTPACQQGGDSLGLRHLLLPPLLLFGSHLQGRSALHSMNLLYCKQSVNKGRYKAVWETTLLIHTAVPLSWAWAWRTVRLVAGWPVVLWLSVGPPTPWFDT